MANKKKKKDESSRTIGIYLNDKIYRQYLLVLHGNNKSLGKHLTSVMEKQLAAFRSANGIDPAVEITKELIDELNAKRKNAT